MTSNLSRHASDRAVVNLERSIYNIKPLEAIFFDHEWRTRTDLPTTCVLNEITEMYRTPFDLNLIARDLCLLLRELCQWFDNNRCGIDPFLLQTRGHLVGSRFVDWLVLPNQDRLAIHDSLCLGLLIFSTQCFTYKTSSNLPYRTRVSRLRASLSKTSAEDWSKYPLVLLWILAMGGISSENEHSAWFVTRLQEVCASLDLDSVDAFIRALQTFLWNDYRLNDTAIDLWIDVQNKSSKAVLQQWPESSMNFWELDPEARASFKTTIAAHDVHDGRQGRMSFSEDVASRRDKGTRLQIDAIHRSYVDSFALLEDELEEA